ncbi:hypothetical protein [Jannaschia seohaensis]|uniref:ElaB/YqjD/DUF883 family membrane-anchored ribosome-binding protein n=1 Tax=Jannaschia seohaensis TaxID=475081 RepID=A0A2Y9A818_9RHOB|nr:hypothetical protein [Jannaschia seohaensis]PWJ22049.1 hypothetical protein BCF38_101458 [Jannaschia seohaensis]SSA38327.1 hypothetical protein SAMN05421539_101458 [Jannaschia seohaensis]
MADETSQIPTGSGPHGADIRTDDDPIETTRHKAEETADAVKSRARTLGDEAAHAAQNLAASAKSRATAEIDRRSSAARDGAASAVDDTAETLRCAAERMTEGTPQGEAAAEAADTVHGMADRIRETSPQDVLDATSDFARRHPAAFLAGVAVAGFAAGRFFKASARATSLQDRAVTATRPAPGAAEAKGA